jgi:branched-chain amino acid aminotransferase
MNANPFASGAAWIEGVVCPLSEARIPILDWGFLRSDATYDVAHVWNGRFFRLDDHLDRFMPGVARLRYDLPVDRTGIADILRDLVWKTALTQAYVAMIATRGTPRPGSRDPRLCTNRFYAFAIPFVWIADPDKQNTGLHLHISNIPRIPPASVDPTVKNYHWLDFQMALLEAYDAGCETVAISDGAGNVVEGPGFNIFAVKDGRMATPATGALEGITRRTMFEIAASLELRCEARPVSAAEMRRADEVIITSTAGGVMPVTRIDGSDVGNGRPGWAFRRLHEAYWALHT